jgi:hypothetical protein
MIKRLKFSLCCAVCVLVVCANTFAQEGCPNFCSEETCLFDSLQNIPLGNATLSIDENCQLVVSNIGGSGRDGVVQSELGSVFMKTTLATPNFSGSMTGTSLFVRQVGIVDGQPEREIMRIRIVNYNGTHVRHAVHCSYIKVQSYTISIYNQGELVAFGNVKDPPILIYPKEDIISAACGIWPNGDTFTEVRIGSPQPINLLRILGNPDIGPFTGDVIFIEALGPEEIPTMQTDIENIFFQTGPMAIAAMEAGDLPERFIQR